MADTHHPDHSQFLRFEFDGQSFALDVLKTREVLSAVKITPLPSALDFLSGVINLRGSVIPVVGALADAVKDVLLCEPAILSSAVFRGPRAQSPSWASFFSFRS
jgi:hypothetical protein